MVVVAATCRLPQPGRGGGRNYAGAPRLHRARRSIQQRFSECGSLLAADKPSCRFFFRLWQTTKTKGAAKRHAGYFPSSIFQFQLVSGVASATP
jgi:hypothetical protein